MPKPVLDGVGALIAIDTEARAAGPQVEAGAGSFPLTTGRPSVPGRTVGDVLVTVASPGPTVETPESLVPSMLSYSRYILFMLLNGWKRKKT